MDIPTQLHTDSKGGEQCTIAAEPECRFWQEVMTEKRGKQKYTQTHTHTGV